MSQPRCLRPHQQTEVHVHLIYLCSAITPHPPTGLCITVTVSLCIVESLSLTCSFAQYCKQWPCVMYATHMLCMTICAVHAMHVYTVCFIYAIHVHMQYICYAVHVYMLYTLFIFIKIIYAMHIHICYIWYAMHVYVLYMLCMFIHIIYAMHVHMLFMLAFPCISHLRKHCVSNLPHTCCMQEQLLYTSCPLGHPCCHVPVGKHVKTDSVHMLSIC